MKLGKYLFLKVIATLVIMSFGMIASCGPSSSSSGGANNPLPTQNTGGGPNPCDTNGPMTADITGTVILTFGGDALVTYTTAAPTVWYLTGNHMDTPDDAIINVWFTFNAGDALPVTVDLKFIPPPIGDGYANLVSPTDPLTSYQTDATNSGTITINSYSGTRMTGIFEFNGMNQDNNDTVTVTNGTFDVPVCVTAN